MSKKDNSNALGISEEEFIDRLRYYHEHQKEIEHKKKKEEYEKLQAKKGEFLLNGTFAGVILKKNGYEIYDIHQANEDFRKIMKLDETKEIAGVYQTCRIYKGKKQVKDHIITIKKTNFYNAFYQPIWKNLTIPEKIKSLEWMFETINEERNLGIKQIRYLPDDLQLIDSNGYFRYGDDFLFFNIDCLNNTNSYLQAPHILAHELMHARQAKYIKRFNIGTQTDLYTLAQTELDKADYRQLSIDYKLDYATEMALYNTSLSEKTADLQALKTIKKYIDLNNKQFGKCKKITHDFRNHIYGQLFEETTRRKAGNKLHFEAVDAILTNEEIVLKGQSEFLFKLLLLKSFYEYETDAILKSLKTTEKDIEVLKDKLNKKLITNKEFLESSKPLLIDIERCKKYIKENDEKLELIKKSFDFTLQNAKKPEYFDEKIEFKPLKLIDEPKSKYSLPRWLHELEDKNRKSIEKQKKKFGIKVKEEQNL